MRNLLNKTKCPENYLHIWSRQLETELSLKLSTVKNKASHHLIYFFKSCFSNYYTFTFLMLHFCKIKAIYTTCETSKGSSSCSTFPQLIHSTVIDIFYSHQYLQHITVIRRPTCRHHAQASTNPTEASLQTAG